MVTSNWDKFVLLLWKNWILQKRHYIQTLFEILIPALCCAILLLVRGLVDPEYVNKNTVFSPLETDRLPSFSDLPSDKPIIFTLAYSPQNDVLEQIVRDAVQSLNANDPRAPLNYAPFRNAQEMESFLVESSYLGGVEFDDRLASLTVADGLPDSLTFALRFPGELRHDESQFSSGTAFINGYDIRTDMEGVRSSLGLCPQHNVLFHEMTVEEHLKFFSRLKGVAKSAVPEEIDRYLNLLELTDKRRAQSHTLSGGMKRKLAVGMALCGGSKVVLLDEPTSGMDPSARRALWNLLQREKQNRTMLLSTHFMDEADVLGDRIAIMSEGKLKAVGSPFFLKKTFGVGYRLICVKDSMRCDKQRLLNILRRHIPDVTFDTDIGSELSFILKEDYIDVFQRLLEDIEQDMAACGITSYGISLTTMEEVFLKAGSDSFNETANHTNGTVVETNNQEYVLDKMHLLTGMDLYKNQIWAQVLKKYFSTIRAWKQLAMMFLIPIFFVAMTFIITRSISSGVDLPSLEIEISSYERSITVLQHSSGETERVAAFQRLFETHGGLVNIQEDMTEYIVRKSIEDIATVNTQYFVGATITSGAPYIGWFNNKAFHTLLFGVEYGVVQRLFSRNTFRKQSEKAPLEPTTSSDVDSDVLDEKRRIANLSKAEIDAHNLLLRDMTKYYGDFQAVNKLSIGIHHSECFGLLGINGAGKTTTFKMMTGDESISSGDGWVRGVNLRTDMNRVHQQIGYCPQFDALLEDLTGRETLRIFALLRGVRSTEIKNVSYILAEELNFAKHLDKRTKAYSGGNKRKLSTALALMGNPAVVYLDEPTTGMDPGAKRQFWDVICKVRSTGKSIVLTSHSMEECEALCTRLAIMVNGEFKCLGSTQHLKNKFSKGFLLTVKVARGTPQEQLKRIIGVKDFVSGQFLGAVLKEEYDDSLSFHIPVTDLKWSQMFGLMESHKQTLEIDDYALGQTSLEQVFLFFTKYQRTTE
ncbi:phospholipid-transporting ATPase ABCA3-like [Anopheles cruzii]|uniref:phospholipid-transporting ATPase ABCA3-like n=1 Tax=Anopheles cruzii TaxID=68878 RepID=UPI0022EC6760|nr:phospholipid-transporting ATPase ABCA3-like [Anopheles cruzii]